MASRSKKKAQWGKYSVYVPPRGSPTRTTPIIEDIRGTDAYRVLSTTARLVLFDMIRVHCKETSWESREEKFNYTWKQCLEPLSENTFNKARREVLEAGFFDARPEDQGRDPGGPIFYRASTRWMTFEASPEQNAKWTQHTTRKQSRISRQHERRRDFRAGLQEKKPTSNSAVGVGNHPRKNCGSKIVDNRKNCGDGRLRKGDDLPQKLRGYDFTMPTACNPPVLCVGKAENPCEAENAPSRPNGGGIAARIQTATGCDGSMFKWWRRIQRDFDEDGARVLETWLTYMEDCGNPSTRERKKLSPIPNPGAFLLGKIAIWAKSRRIALPPLPEGVQLT